MAQLINVKSTIAQAEGFAVEVADSVLLSTRYFPNSEGDNFATKEVLFDFEDADLERGAFLTTTYKNGKVDNWRADSVTPPRVAVADTVDPKGLDRVMFERLQREMGADGRAAAYQSLLELKAARLAVRVDRSIELLAALVLRTGAIEFDQAHDSTGADWDSINVKYYDPEKGCNNHFAPSVAWGTEGATPYRDICAMVSHVVKHGNRPADLLLGAEAWQNLVADDAFKYFPNAIHTEGNELSFGEIDGAQYVGTGVFNGIRLNLICYSGAFKNTDGELITYIEPTAAIVISENVGRTLQGGCTLLNPDSNGYELANSFIDLRGRHCQSIYKDFDKQTLEIREESRPLPAPRHSVNSIDWVYCDTAAAVSGGAFGVIYNGIKFEHVNSSGEVVTPSTPASYTGGAVVGGSSVTITPAADGGKTYKYFAADSTNSHGKELTLSGSSLNVPIDTELDGSNAVIIVVELD